ncbi:hypothetical protein LNO81_10830 [Klebsiella variicola subsp. variicola]|nr:hypothetical protein [Klebsiella variicola subsp. variicola]
MAAGLAMAGTRHVSDAAPILNILQRVGAMAGAALVTACYVRLAHTQGKLSRLSARQVDTDQRRHTAHPFSTFHGEPSGIINAGRNKITGLASCPAPGTQ